MMVIPPVSRIPHKGVSGVIAVRLGFRVPIGCAAMLALTGSWAGAWVGALGALVAPGVAAAAVFSGLGDLSGGPALSTAFGVSHDGNVVVGLSASGSGAEAVSWTGGGPIVSLGDLPGGAVSARATAASCNGAVIVGGGTSASGAEAFRASGGAPVGLGDLPGGAFESAAFAVSCDGSVAVGGSDAGGGGGAWRDSGGGLVDLTVLPGGISSIAADVSCDGNVVVGTSYDGSRDEAFRWTSGGSMVGLGVPGLHDPATSDSQGLGVSCDGSVVVGTGTFGVGSGLQAFRWTAATGMEGLGDLSGGSRMAQANAVSDDGHVVVGFGTPDGGASVAVVWTSALGLIPLQPRLEAALGLDLTGWTLTEAHDVSGDGLVIVGEGTNPSGDLEAWRVVFDPGDLPAAAPPIPLLAPVALGLLLSALGAVAVVAVKQAQAG